MTATATKPIDVACPACQSRPREWCTAPTDTGRRYVRWFHLARETAAAFPTREDDDDGSPEGH